MFDNFLPIPDAESLLFYSLALKLVVCVKFSRGDPTPAPGPGQPPSLRRESDSNLNRRVGGVAGTVTVAADRRRRLFILRRSGLVTVYFGGHALSRVPYQCQCGGPAGQEAELRVY